MKEFDVEEWDVQAECNVLMQVGNDDQKELGAALLDAHELCVIGSEGKIEEQKEMFLEIKTL